MSKKQFFPSLTALVLACAPSPVFANDQKIDALLQDLTTPQKNYVLSALDYKIDPKLLKKSYEVNWLIPPKFNFTATELKAAQSPVKVKMTVIASSGIIAKVEILKSTGSKVLDAKVIAALMQAKLESIARVDRNITYTLIHELEINNPL
ncbi:energy transducer TonB [Acinetobacter terrestris]|uniref:energy transducer TonB n=1 Tax=Acinetobacter terrestris TaxID=2529843 RepID=UPI00103C0FE4|nr:energy transducer TonB [Acinetobacter terrestris]TCB55729.1 energy transducer TonB [Acinetobacter terrestris]